MKLKLLLMLFVAVAASSPVRANPTVLSLIELTDHPDADAARFEEMLEERFRQLGNVQRFGAPDLPPDVTDPMYWALAAGGLHGPADSGGSAMITCNRIGPGSFSAAEAASDVWAPVEGRPRFYGVWFYPMKPFPDDAIARLDCAFVLSDDEKIAVDWKAVAQRLEPQFDNVELQDHQTSGVFVPPGKRLLASGGHGEGLRRVEQIDIRENWDMVDVFFTVWLLKPTS